MFLGYTSVLRLSDRQYRVVVLGRLLLLCVLHSFDLRYQYHHDVTGDKEGAPLSHFLRAFNPDNEYYTQFRRSNGCVKCPGSRVPLTCILTENVSRVTTSLISLLQSSVALGQLRDSTTIVPGDIVNLNDPPLSTLPADLFLLSGDAIVNESMLTGESVPVSKIPVKDDDIARWRDAKDVSGDMAKSFLYAGTRVVRIRNGLTTDGSPGRPALGLVVRTGE